MALVSGAILHLKLGGGTTFQRGAENFGGDTIYYIPPF